MADISIHFVKKIELSLEFLSNGGCRAIKIHTRHGIETITLYGNTEGIAGIEKAVDFKGLDESWKGE